MIDDVLKAVALLNKYIAEQKPACEAPLNRFLSECCEHVPGVTTLYKDVYAAYLAWMENESDEVALGKISFSRALPPQFPYGVAAGNQRFIGNLRLRGEWRREKNRNDTPMIVGKDGRLRRNKS